MRDGLVIDTQKTKETNVDELVRKMVGRSITDYYPPKNAEIREIVFDSRPFIGRIF